MREVNQKIKERIAEIKTKLFELENEAEYVRKKMKEARNELHDIDVSDLWINTYSLNSLRSNEILTLGQVIELGEQELMRMPRISTATIKDIKNELSLLGWDLPYEGFTDESLPFFLKRQAE